MASPRVIALDLGGTKLLSGVVNAEGVVERRIVHETETDSELALLEQVDAAIEDLLGDDIGGIGMGLPSLIDQRKGEAVASVNIPLAGIAFRDHLHDRFGLPAGVREDADPAAPAQARPRAGPGPPPMGHLPP